MWMVAGAAPAKENLRSRVASPPPLWRCGMLSNGLHPRPSRRHRLRPLFAQLVQWSLGVVPFPTARRLTFPYLHLPILHLATHRQLDRHTTQTLHSAHARGHLRRPPLG